MPRNDKQNRDFLCETTSQRVQIKTHNDWSAPIIFNGIHYDFSHLMPIHFSVVKEEKPGKFEPFTFELIVVFDCHVVTEKFSRQGTDSLADATHFWVDKGGWLRQFCPARYEKSKRLAALVVEAANDKRHVYQTDGSNAMVLELGVDSSSLAYVIYFDLTVVNKNIGGSPRIFRMYIQSAYEKEIKPRRSSQTYVAKMCLELSRPLEAKFSTRKTVK